MTFFEDSDCPPIYDAAETLVKSLLADVEEPEVPAEDGVAQTGGCITIDSVAKWQ